MNAAIAVSEQATSITSGTYGVDPVHSRVEFEVRHLGISTFRGGFSVYDGEIVVGEDGIERVDGSIEVSSVQVPEKQLVGHLLSSDFFDAENHPKGRFTSTAIESVDGERLKVTGDLTLRGITHPVEVDLEVAGAGVGLDGSDVLSLEARGTINRNDYGISWGATVETGAAVVAEKVRLVLTVEAVKAGE
jgi:polyisoprenoid-binding protein YceI